jgi:hypothetical protein
MLSLFLTIVNKKIPPFDQILGKVVAKCGSNKFLLEFITVAEYHLRIWCIYFIMKYI